METKRKVDGSYKKEYKKKKDIKQSGEKDNQEPPKTRTQQMLTRPATCMVVFSKAL